MKQYRKYPILAFLIPVSLIILEVSCTSPDPSPNNPPPVSIPIVPIVPMPENKTGSILDKPIVSSSGALILPMDRALARVTKKTFWLRVSPGDSPVSPERFTGYHTGADFETFPSEQNEDIKIRAACSGPLVLKKWATGYGGVAVQQCRLEWQDMTVVYGHLKFESISPPIHSTVQSGQLLWILGRGFSRETDGERKHLHLGIHLWSKQDIRGYAATYAELNQWIDPLKYMK